LRTFLALAIAVGTAAVRLGAQPGATVPSGRLAILVAEQRRAPTARDVTTLRTGVRSRDPQTARLAVRAIGRLERPSLIADLLPALRSPFPEHRAEAATAIGQAAQGWRDAASATTSALSPASVLDTLIDRLAAEEDSGARAAIAETIGRLPFRGPSEALRAEAALVEQAGRSATAEDRLGVAKGLEAFVRIHRQLQPPSSAALETLRALAGVPAATATWAIVDPSREPRVRRLALEALLAAGALDEDLVAQASQDRDVQVRRLAMKAARASLTVSGVLLDGSKDPSIMVRVEALRSLGVVGDEWACRTVTAAAVDFDVSIALAAIDALAGCGSHSDSVALLERMARGYPEDDAPRRWHRSAHALLAFAATTPERAAGLLDQAVGSTQWQRRMYAARAAAILKHREALEKLARDSHDNVAGAAIEGLAAFANHDHDSLYIAALSRPGDQVVRAAALALRDTPNRAEAVPALQAALTRLSDENREHPSSAREAVTAVLTSLGAAPGAPRGLAADVAAGSQLDAADLRRLAAPRARITVRDVGTFELALFTSEAPATVLHFARLAEAGQYNGLTFHRVVPNSLAQGGSPGDNEDVGFSDRLRDEVGMWPHVRGTVGIASRGRDAGNGQFFINLVDNPGFDHEYTVFGQLLNGTEVIDRILEGDIIDRVEILP
jgi:cyclophilin family peptidyl-prolyl cis-trans isomerase/HEAT repeat protein